MKIHEEKIVKIPIEEIVALLKKEYRVDVSGVEPELDGEYLIFRVATLEGTQPTFNPSETKPRRRRGKRNRIKTRGWNVIAKITNSKGLKANIYEPFVKALEGKELSKTEQRKIVKDIIISNGNDPKSESVDYMLENTLEYLKMKQEKTNS